MSNQVLLTVDLGYGDQGKGPWVDLLARKYDARWVVRYNGGAQAAHNVVTPEGRHHTFSSFGAASFLPAVKTFLSQHMIVHPAAMLAEGSVLNDLHGIRDIWSRTFVDGRALVNTRYHGIYTKLLELSRGRIPHGSCGVGIGATVAYAEKYPEDALRVQDLVSKVVTHIKLSRMRERIYTEALRLLESIPSAAVEKVKLQDDLKALENADSVDWLWQFFDRFASRVAITKPSFVTELFGGSETCIFEGAQGVMLDQKYGTFPFVTRSNTTLSNAFQILAEAGYKGKVLKYGIIRSYGTRHGAGPFVTEDSSTPLVINDHNQTNDWQGSFRVGHLDAVALKYAVKVVGVLDGILLSCLDNVSSDTWVKACHAYNTNSPSAHLYFEDQQSDGVYGSIKVDRNTTLERQAELTNELFKCTPHYITAAGVEGLSNYIEQTVQTPVKGLSFGPTAIGRQYSE